MSTRGDDEMEEKQKIEQAEESMPAKEYQRILRKRHYEMEKLKQKELREKTKFERDEAKKMEQSSRDEDLWKMLKKAKDLKSS